MKSFPENIKFKYSWRTYQKNFLNHLNEYLIDNHLHIIAPPGSGKTVLGLEVMLRLNKPTLIVAPTLAIRNQWVQRFCELFLEVEDMPEWISTDLKNLGFVTVTTYQGIYSAFINSMDVDKEQDEISSNFNVSKIVKTLKKNKIEIFIFDEAHHLKKAWWKSLIELKHEVNPIIISLTATPPFDVSALEWQRYIQLNGNIDVEISVPELMLEGDLCPHQDLVYFTLPTEKEHLKIEHYYTSANQFFDEIRNDDMLLNTLENHPVFRAPQEHLEWIYENISSYSSVLIYLHFRGRKIAEVHFEIIGDQEKYIPEFDFFWMEELLDFYLFVDDENVTEHRLKLENRLRREGFIEEKMVNFFNNKNLVQTLNSSVGKFNGIKEIVDFEYSALQDELKMVILTDFIKKEYLNNGIENNFNLDKLGAIPIFEKLRRENTQNVKIGVLTGSIIIIPKTAKDRFDQLYSKVSISNEFISLLPYDENYFIIYVNDQLRSHTVHIVTEIFQCGQIQILIGTKSLLGEGWDAPKMNSLILASFVSSFVLSNQMRGRVIRTQKDNPDKTGNIWHLVCFDKNNASGGEDFNVLKRRFKTFVGISNDDDPTIENNFERLRIKEIESVNDIVSINKSSFLLANERNQLSKKWKLALGKGNILIEEIKIPLESNREAKQMKLSYLSKMMSNFSMIVISSFVMFWWDFFVGMFKSAKSVHFESNFSWLALIFGFVGFVTYSGKFYRALKQYLKYKNIAKHIEIFGDIILKNLLREKIIITPIEKLSVISTKDNEGNAICYLSGGTNYEKAQFIMTLQELISPVDNPRYLLKQKTFSFFIKSDNYYPLPEVFAKNKKSAEFFNKTWSELMDKSELVFTRTIEGRKILIKLRFQSLMKRNARIEHLHKWSR
ncbi:DEAD/DEAH box helicase family protein [Chryseobacterium sp. YIM B02567]|uniref:DEAD/DEAH box helicase family protein n=1 Tax=Chryseobacterium paridis TaxID=2800328 RepID=A0ABS1FPH6_9FLAO|nr:DEAD/DEAH box helicase family protein [Chryseobacterium paridis]